MKYPIGTKVQVCRPGSFRYKQQGTVVRYKEENLFGTIKAVVNTVAFFRDGARWDYIDSELIEVKSK